MNGRGCKRSSSGTNFSQADDRQKRYRKDEADFSDGKKTGRPCAANAERERSRVKTLRTAFLDLQRTLPSVPADTKLSKLDVLVLATTYIAHLMKTLNDDVSGDDVAGTRWAQNVYHPMKKWPMRSRLYQGITSPDAALQEQTIEAADNRFNTAHCGQNGAFDGKVSEKSYTHMDSMLHE
ncbi:transcription factor 24-like [Lineus longissimus]|uniref:transcription factor 24-like n=1 Tax=Lineus longissimus TaxID=88925 RepID=UPI002B4F76F1